MNKSDIISSELINSIFLTFLYLDLYITQTKTYLEKIQIQNKHIPTQKASTKISIDQSFKTTITHIIHSIQFTRLVSSKWSWYCRDRQQLNES